MAIPEKLMDGIQRLDPLPFTVQKLTVALQDEKLSTEEIAGIVEYDGAIAANVLRVANSAAYGGRFRTKRIKDAVVRLGSANLLNIILGDYLKTLRAAAPMYDLTEDDFWLHSAAASFSVTAMMGESRRLHIPQIATIAALLHDIGKLVIVRYMRVNVAAVLSVAKEKQLPFVDAERELLGCDHTEVGAEMARKWNFPPHIAHAIEQHHRVPVQSEDPVLDAVMLANLAAKSIGTGLGAAGMNFCVDYAGSRKRLGLTMESFERVCAQALIWLNDLRKVEGVRDRRVTMA